MFFAGFRSYRTINYTTGLVTLDDKGSFLYAEVTNDGAEDITFSPNIYLKNGLADGGGITIKAATTRIIPMSVYNFQATGACIVTAYRM
jgi:hypothetical protein